MTKGKLKTQFGREAVVAKLTDEAQRDFTALAMSGDKQAQTEFWESNEGVAPVCILLTYGRDESIARATRQAQITNMLSLPIAIKTIVDFDLAEGTDSWGDVLDLVQQFDSPQDKLRVLDNEFAMAACWVRDHAPRMEAILQGLGADGSATRARWAQTMEQYTQREQAFVGVVNQIAGSFLRALQEREDASVPPARAPGSNLH